MPHASFKGKSMNFTQTWTSIRVYTLFTCFIVMIVLTLSSFSHPFDFDCRAGEGQTIERELRNEENREAFERVQKGEAEEGDHHKALDWMYDNIAIKSIQFDGDDVYIIGKKPLRDDRSRD